MKILRDEAVALCEALSFLTAKRWDKKKMTTKLGEIAELALNLSSLRTSTFNLFLALFTF